MLTKEKITESLGLCFKVWKWIEDVSILFLDENFFNVHATAFVPR